MKMRMMTLAMRFSGPEEGESFYIQLRYIL
jgi:hypothetical protein